MIIRTFVCLIRTIEIVQMLWSMIAVSLPGPFGEFLSAVSRRRRQMAQMHYANLGDTEAELLVFGRKLRAAFLVALWPPLAPLNSPVLKLTC